VAASFPVNIVTPERTVLSADAESIQVATVNGSLGVLKGHAPLLAMLGSGECVIRLDNQQIRRLAISGGCLDVSRERVTVLADAAEFEDEIDASRAEEALTKARQLLASTDASERDNAAEAMRRAQARLRVVRGSGR
jgi:F-type H+-transporting ATPase subunit epsilon